MKKSIIIGAFSVIAVTVLIVLGIFYKDYTVNDNRYGSLSICDNVLFYYANGCVCSYSNGTTSVIEKASGIYFSVERFPDKGRVIVYQDEASMEESPYYNDPKVNGAVTVVSDSQHVYARFPGGRSYIVVYIIDQKSRELKECDRITY